MSNLDCDLIPLGRVRPTEEVCATRVREVMAMIAERRAWTQPICIEGTVGALLDGHHRLAAAHTLGLARIPVHIFDYADVALTSWRPDFAPTRAEVLARAISGILYPHKTTRHTFAARPMTLIPLSSLIDLDLNLVVVPSGAFHPTIARERPGASEHAGR